MTLGRRGLARQSRTSAVAASCAAVVIEAPAFAYAASGNHDAAPAPASIDHRAAGRHQAPDAVRVEGDPPLPCGGLFDHADRQLVHHTSRSDCAPTRIIVDGL